MKKRALALLVVFAFVLSIAAFASEQATTAKPILSFTGTTANCSLTVKEFGANINATLIVIENADRFGLSQLHQLRGRVGRGEHKSYCVLFNQSDSAESAERLKAMCRLSDGFKISEVDLKLRGPGDFFGSRQSGLPATKLAELSCDTQTLYAAQDEAKRLFDSDPELKSFENQALADKIKQFSNSVLN